MNRHHRTRRAGAAGLALTMGFAAVACSGTTSTSTNSGATAPPSSAAPTTAAPTTMAPATPKAAPASTDTKAAELRATLTDQLVSHVYLAGITINTAVGTSPDSPQTQAAAAALDKNSVDLASSVSSVYGDAAGDQFLELWRKHIGFFVDYTVAKASNDQAKATKAKTDLDKYREDFGAFLASANPNLTKDAVADALVPHVDTLFAAIDKVVAKDPGAFDALKTAAAAMPKTADTLAGAIAKQKNLDGDVDSKASGLRAGLTYLLDEHVYLASITVVTALGTSPDSAETKAASATLDKNSVELADAVGSVYGKPAGDQFLELWRKHIGFFVDYTVAKASNDQAKATKAKADLDKYREDFGAFLASANPNLTKAAVADALVPHVTTLFAAIDKAAAKDAGTYEAVRVAAGEMPKTANTLAGAIAKQKF